LYCFPVGIFQGLTMINSYFQKGNIIHLFVLIIDIYEHDEKPYPFCELANTTCQIVKRYFQSKRDYVVKYFNIKYPSLNYS
jgi:hypothetical protein